MNNFYDLFEIMPSASKKEIIGAYENKITKYNNIYNLSDSQIYEIKLLKIGLYILTNSELKKKYDLAMGIKKNNQNRFFQDKSNHTPKENFESPSAVNENYESNLDSLFNVDNSWMKEVNIDSNNKKQKFETNIGERIFSLSEMNQRPGYSSDFEASLRKPLQGREDRSDEMLNKNKINII